MKPLVSKPFDYVLTTHNIGPYDDVSSFVNNTVVVPKRSVNKLSRSRRKLPKKKTGFFA